MSDSASGVTVATWNLQWAESGSERGRRVMEVLKARGDVIVATECDVGLFDQGYVVEAGKDWGYPPGRPGRRKVAMWSSRPWRDVDQVGHLGLPGGRFVAATTATPVGELRVVGLCVPWWGAHVDTGRRDRRRWEDHEVYLAALGAVLADQPRPLLVAGDFNQRIPRTRQPESAAELLADALKGLEVITAGDTPEGPLIDHLAISNDLTGRVTRLLRGQVNGQELSDHTGVTAELAPSRS